MDINSKIKSLDSLIEDLGELEQFMDEKLLKSNYDSIMKEVSPNDRIDLNWNMSYAEYTLYYCKLSITYYSMAKNKQQGSSRSSSQTGNEKNPGILQ